MLWSDALDQLFNALLALLLGMARIFPCLLLTPIFSFSAIKGVLRTAIVAALALFIAPLLYHDMLGASLSLVAYAGLAIKELILGTLIGLILGLPFWMYESVGALFDNQRGALMGGQINPQLGPDATPLGYLMKQVIILLLIVGPGLNAATQLIWDSYRFWPPLTGCRR